MERHTYAPQHANERLKSGQNSWASQLLVIVTSSIKTPISREWFHDWVSMFIEVTSTRWSSNTSIFTWLARGALPSTGVMPSWLYSRMRRWSRGTPRVSSA